MGVRLGVKRRGGVRPAGAEKNSSGKKGTMPVASPEEMSPFHYRDALRLCESRTRTLP